MSFGMLMPGRNGQSNLQGGFSSGGTTTVNGNTYASNLTVATRIGNTPNTYKAATSIEFIGEYVDNGNEEYEAFIVNQANPDPNPTTGTVYSSSGDVYRYGFNGKENDKDISEGGQDYGMRIYDGRLGKFLSVDPLTKKYPELTPYQFASNRPIDGIDLDGLEFMAFQKSMYRIQYGEQQASNSVKTSSSVINVVYSNIPSLLQDPVYRDFKYTYGGPVTIWGRDWDIKLDGDYASRQGRYNFQNPKFNGLAVDANEPEPTASTRGVKFGYEGATIVTPFDAAKQLAEFATNMFNGFGLLPALKTEYEARQGFYSATNLVDSYLKPDPATGLSATSSVGLVGEKDRSDLINFVTDGYLNTAVTNNFSGLEFKNLRREAYGHQLKIANAGLQILKNNNIEIKQETKKAIQALIGKYKEDGGNSEYDKILNN